MGCFSHLHNFLVLVSTTNSYPKSTLVISSSQSWLKPHLVTSLDFVTKIQIWTTCFCCCIAGLVCTCHECLSMKVFDSRDALPIPIFLPTHRAIQPLFNHSWAQEPLTKGASKRLKVQGEASFGDIPKIKGPRTMWLLSKGPPFWEWSPPVGLPIIKNRAKVIINLQHSTSDLYHGLLWSGWQGSEKLEWRPRREIKAHQWKMIAHV